MPKETFNRGITLIGAGNVGTHLLKVFNQKGYQINQVFSRNFEKAQKAADIAGALAINKTEDINPDADLFILAVKDSAITELADKLKLNGLVVHTSGTARMQILNTISSNIGVFYPLQTFTKDRNLDWNNIPICLEAKHSDDLLKLNLLAKDLSENVLYIESVKRIKLHLAAVFVNNFCNYLLSIGADIARNNSIDFNILYPLAKETVEKAFAIAPWNAQTGPALRKDTTTMEQHLSLLSNKKYHEIYRILSEAIDSEDQDNDNPATDT